MGRTNGHTAEEVSQTIRDANGMVSSAARKLGVSRKTIYNYINRYVTVKEALDEAREELLDMTEAQLFKAIKGGNVTAIMFTLKTIGKDRGYVERVQQEHTIKDVSTLTDDELRAIIKG